MTIRQAMVPSVRVWSQPVEDEATDGPLPFVLPQRDELTMKMRPELKYRAGTILVDRSGNGDVKTLEEALRLIPDARTVAMAIAGESEVSPKFRVDIALAPGVYDEPLTRGIEPHVALYALDPTPGSTVVRWGTDPGGFNYWEGIDIVNVDNNGEFDPKYAVHLAATGTSIFTCCSLRNEAPKAGGYPIPIGMDGYQGSTLVMHRVNLETADWLNLHGSGEPGWSKDKPGMNVVFSECKFPSGSLFYSALNDFTADEVWAVDCEALGAGLVGGAGKLHISNLKSTGKPNNYVGHYTYAGKAFIEDKTDERRDWPVPVGGVSASDRVRFGM